MSAGTHPADQTIVEYFEAFRLVYGHDPRAHYLGNQWYQVNGQPVHQSILVRETRRLLDLAQIQRARYMTEEAPTWPAPRPRPRNPHKTAIQRIIQRLRRM